MNQNFHITLTMKSAKYILIISIIAILVTFSSEACCPEMPYSPSDLRIFRCCSPELVRQWREGCRFQDYEKYENSLLWQNVTSASIPQSHIQDVVYGATLKDLLQLPDGPLSDNQYARWLINPEHREDLDYILLAKEIEELREYMSGPWYYAYDGDEEHLRLEQLMSQCEAYNGSRHTARYALQMARLYFAEHDYGRCIDLWEKTVSSLPDNVITDMIASYVGGAYYRMGNREKAIELFTRGGDIGSLISIKGWNYDEEKSRYSDSRVKKLEYIFNRFPDSPLLSVKLQDIVGWMERQIYSEYEPINRTFFDDLSKFAEQVISSVHCHQQGMWRYALAFINYLDGNIDSADFYLGLAEKSESTAFIRESIKAFRLLLNSRYANNSTSYRNLLLRDLTWLDERMLADSKLIPDSHWQYDNEKNWPFYYWQDVARKVLLGSICPKLQKQDDVTLALQLANYACNRIIQVSPLYTISTYGDDGNEPYINISTFDEYRRIWPYHNDFDYSNQFFESINGVNADNAARYAERITRPETELDNFLNERSYVDCDYIYEIVGTLYLREMNYEKATEWFSRVSEDYQSRTNIAKDGFFKMDPFRLQFYKKHYIADSSDYKLRFAQKMSQLEHTMNSDAEPNRKAQAKIRYAIGLRNSFDSCWYLTDYGRFLAEYHSRWFSMDYDDSICVNYEEKEKAFTRSQSLITDALNEFTNAECAADAQLEMMNHYIIMNFYSTTKAAEYVRGHCDSCSYDYELQKR